MRPPLEAERSAKKDPNEKDPKLGETAFIFPGQGSQYPGMGREISEMSEAARGVFNTADKILDFHLSQICFNGPEEELNTNTNTQLGIVVTSYAALQALKERYPARKKQVPRFFSGHSLGEYTALIAAGVLSFEHALQLVRKRAELTQIAAERRPGKMAAVIDSINQAGRRISEQMGIIAADNSERIFTISTGIEVFNEAKRRLEEMGAKVRELPIFGRFHSKEMESILDEFRRAVCSLPFSKPSADIILNVTARPSQSIEEIQAGLCANLTQPVLWKQSWQYMLLQGVRCFIEPCPKPTLTQMLPREPNIRGIAVFNATSLLSSELGAV